MVTNLLPTKTYDLVRRGIARCGTRVGRGVRAGRERQIAKVPLTEQHIQNCELVLNRSAMLSKLVKHGRVAELGVCRGEFSDEILKTTTPDVLHLIDAWHTDRYDDSLFEDVSRRFSGQITSGQTQLHRKLSLDAIGDFSDHYFDWIYIDTDHGYEATLKELVGYSTKIKTDGIIAGHDYTVGNWVKSFRYGVIEAVHEFCVDFGWELVFLTVDPIEHQSFAIRRIPK